MSTLAATSYLGFARFWQWFVDFGAAFLQAADPVTTDILPAHLSARAKRLMRADY